MLNTKNFYLLAILANQFLETAELKYPTMYFEKHLAIKHTPQLLCQVVSLKYLHILVVT